jgi:hypothetical protein
MNERLVEDWLTNANERTFETPFAQSLLSSGMEVLRVGHGPHEHGKDVIAIDDHGRVHAYQLKGGDVGLNELQAIHGQLVALVETPVEHPGLAAQTQHQSYLVLSGELSIPAADRLRAHNAGWKQRGYKPLKTISGAQLLTRFTKMSVNFWPQRPQDARTFLSLYLADPGSTLDREAFAKVVFNTLGNCANGPKAEVLRRLAAINLFSSYALAPFYAAGNYWEIVQGWTMTAAYIAWAATVGNVRKMPGSQCFACQLTPPLRL